MPEAGFGTLPAPVLPRSRPVSPEVKSATNHWSCPATGDVFALTSLSQLQIDAIIRRARSKVCTRHISAGSIAAFSGDAGDDVESAAPAESDHSRGFLSPDSTPQRSNPREASRSGVSGAYHVAGSQSQSHTQPAPASYTNMGHSAGADDLIRL